MSRPAPQHPPTAAVTIHAYDEKPIILVEDFDRILSGVSCSGYVSSALWDVIAFDFIDEPAFALAAQEWATIQGSFVITCHAGCNANGERGAWRYVLIPCSGCGQRLTAIPQSYHDSPRLLYVEDEHGRRASGNALHS